MFRRLRDSSFFDLFVVSAEHLVEGSQLLGQLLGADRAERVVLGQRIREVEHSADEATHAQPGQRLTGRLRAAVGEGDRQTSRSRSWPVPTAFHHLHQLGSARAVPQSRGGAATV